MNRHVTALAPRRRSLEIPDQVTEIVGLGKDVARETALAAIRGEYPTLTGFERD